MKNTYTAIIELEDDIYVALCPELDIASQGKTIIEAKENLAEAVELFLETADSSEILQRTHSESYVTRFEVSVG
jgi:predicted RNase H-like HicB family nuclease